MKSALVLVGLVALPQTVPVARAETGARLTPIKAFLCDTADQAIQFADLMAREESEEIAKARVGRSANGEVCGRYVGIAAIELEQVTLKGGKAYKLTAYRFREDHHLAWRADPTFAPVSSTWDL